VSAAERIADEKVVYITGAGFSAPLGIPLQAQLLPEIVQSKRFQAVPLLSEFLGAVFGSTVDASLEDIFTLLDQAVAQRRYCRGYDHEGLARIRNTLRQEILFLIQEKLSKATEEQWLLYRNFGAHLLNKRVDAGLNADPFSIITVNWDCALDDALYWNIHEAKAVGRIDVDYCCYTSPLTNSSPHMPSVLQKAAGLYNVRIMKLHGSANWLLCPNCDRLFTGVGDRDLGPLDYLSIRPCVECQMAQPSKLGSHEQSPPMLEPFMVTPTFLKAFDNTHIQMIWHNAYLDLSQASSVVFLGYSLPEADYHVRNLLRRAIKQEAEIIVVLTKKDEATATTAKSLRRYFPCERYRHFFAGDRVKFVLNGVESFLSQTCAGDDLSHALSALTSKLGR